MIMWSPAPVVGELCGRTWSRPVRRAICAKVTGCLVKPGSGRFGNHGNPATTICRKVAAVSPPIFCMKAGAISCIGTPNWTVPDRSSNGRRNQPKTLITDPTTKPVTTLDGASFVAILRRHSRKRGFRAFLRPGFPARHLPEQPNRDTKSHNVAAITNRTNE